MNIEEITRNYRQATECLKKAKAENAKYREAILEYAKNHPDKFNGRNLLLPNNVSVEIRISEKGLFEQENCTAEWFESIKTNNLGNAVKFKINPKYIPEKPNNAQNRLLKKIGFRTEEERKHAIRIKA